MSEVLCTSRGERLGIEISKTTQFQGKESQKNAPSDLTHLAVRTGILVRFNSWPPVELEVQRPPVTGTFPSNVNHSQSLKFQLFNIPPHPPPQPQSDGLPHPFRLDCFLLCSLPSVTPSTCPVRSRFQILQTKSIPASFPRSRAVCRPHSPLPNSAAPENRCGIFPALLCDCRLLLSPAIVASISRLSPSTETLQCVRSS